MVYSGGRVEYIVYYLHAILYNIIIMHDSTSLSELNIIECLSNIMQPSTK